MFSFWPCRPALWEGVGDAVNQSVVFTFMLLFVLNFFLSSLYSELVPQKGLG